MSPQKNLETHHRPAITKLSIDYCKPLLVIPRSLTTSIVALVIALAAAEGLFLWSQHKKIAELRQQLLLAQALYDELAQSRDQEAKASAAEIARLRGDNADLHRLRSEIRTVKSDAEKLRNDLKRLPPEFPKPAGTRSPRILSNDEIFLSQNAQQPGVISLPSGLQYKVLQQGAGAVPGSNSTVTVHYRGTRVDGTEIDSFYTRGKAADFPVHAVVKGWGEALQMMPAGSKWQLVLPPDLAYGDQGAGEKIPPNSALIFEIELVGIKP